MRKLYLKLHAWWLGLDSNSYIVYLIFHCATTGKKHGHDQSYVHAEILKILPEADKKQIEALVQCAYAQTCSRRELLNTLREAQKRKQQ